MKKILSVSILAMLAVAPLAANATDPHRYAGVTIDETTTAQNGGNDTQKVASTAYVKGAYNAAIGQLDSESARVDGILGGKTTGANVTHDILYKGANNTTDDTIYGNLEKLETAIGSLTNNAADTYVTQDSADATTAKGENQTLHYALGDGEHVGSNLAALDAQVYTNKTGIDTLTTNTTVTTPGSYISANGNVAANLSALDAAVGQKSTLTTTAKDTIVAAINEVDSHADDNAAAIGTMANLGNTAGNNTNFGENDDTLVEAVNVLDADMGKVSTLGGKAASGKTNLTNDDDTLVEAVNELDKDMGYLDDLTTSQKGTLVAAINEVASTASNTYQTQSDSEVTEAMKTANGTGSHLTVGQGVGANLQALDSAILANETDISTNATNIGTLSGLTTTAKNDLVAAVNEVNSKQLTVYSGWNGGAAPTAASSTVALIKTNN